MKVISRLKRPSLIGFAIFFWLYVPCMLKLPQEKYSEVLDLWAKTDSWKEAWSDSRYVMGIFAIVHAVVGFVFGRDIIIVVVGNQLKEFSDAVFELCIVVPVIATYSMMWIGLSVLFLRPFYEQQVLPIVYAQLEVHDGRNRENRDSHL